MDRPNNQTFLNTYNALKFITNIEFSEEIIVNINIYHEKYVNVVTIMGSSIIVLDVEFKGAMLVQYSVYIFEFCRSNLCRWRVKIQIYRIRPKYRPCPHNLPP